MAEAVQTEPGYSATCSCCGAYTRFECDHYSFREGYACTACKASMRYRSQAESILRCFEREGSESLQQLVEETSFRQLRIYEPGVAGPFRKYFRALANYQTSFYWSEVERGAQREGVRCEDLEQLTFEDDQFDLLISSDIFEHIRKPMHAFKEVHRVLRPGGAHIFSIPVEHPMSPTSTARVDVSGHEDIHILPEHYHGDGAGGKSLVYNDFGADLIGQLNSIGFLCETERPAPLVPAASKTITFVCWKL